MRHFRCVSLVDKAGQKKSLKKKAELRRSVGVVGSHLFFFFHPRLITLGGSLHTLFSFDLQYFLLLVHFCTLIQKMSAVQPVAVYALRVPPGAMVPAVPNAAASVSKILRPTE